MVVAPPGPEARRLSQRLERAEAPGINTLYGGAPNVLWREALGANVLDVDGNRYIDLTSGFGVAAVGHRHPRVVAAITAQAGQLVHGLGDAMAHPVRLALAERLASLVSQTDRDLPDDASSDAENGDDENGDHANGDNTDLQTYFAVSGADAVEVAAKTALLHHRSRTGLIAFEPAYHGLTLGALALTSRPAFRDPFRHRLQAIERWPFAAPLRSLRQRLRRGDVAAVVVEPIVGREGVIVPPAGWLAELAASCRHTDTLLVADEIFTGFGRTGRLFACSHDAVRPDLLVCGKALGGGLPLGAVIARRSLMAAWSTPGEALHTGTFVAHPLACAAALAVLDVLDEEDLVARAAHLGVELEARLDTWPERFPAVDAVRGRGLLWGIVLRDRDTARRVTAGALARGILLLAGGPEGRVAQLVPSLAIDRAQLDLSLDLLEESLQE
jgi:4-aminobutyrate aminotransferase-like enzyme